MALCLYIYPYIRQYAISVWGCRRQSRDIGSTCQHVGFLGACVKVQKVTINFIASACPSVQPHETTWLPLDGFS